MLEQCPFMQIVVVEAQYAVNVELQSYQTDWNERFPCPSSLVCSAKFQYCLKPHGSPENENCLMNSFREVPSVPADMADNVIFNRNESYAFSSPFPVITTVSRRFS